MTTPADPTPAPPPAPGLPPVTPPSGRFIAQLFLVPGMIVLVAVMIILAINYLFIGGYTPAYFLSKLDSDNADIRWRGASDLAQHIKRPESKRLKADAAFALDLADRLRDALADLDQAERELAAKIAKLPPTDQDKEWRRLTPRKKRDYVEYLAAALGDFYVPVGVPLLCEIIEREEAPDRLSNTMRRRRAIWALSNLGAHVQAFARELSAEQQAAALEQMSEELAGPASERRRYARTALHYLDKSKVAADEPGLVLVDHALARCARSADRYLREHVAMAFNFWDGDRAEETLLRLAEDDGFGALIRVAEDD
ncbi:MAG: hypothetical protein L0Y71_12235 [Gemmataceae bacterium]|nr:hypothetical protein [Gemmataceae bacterium]